MEAEGNFKLALLLAGLAGWVDAAGLRLSHGLFLSFMSGNTTQLGVSVSDQDTSQIITIAAIIMLFVAGVVFGEVIEPRGGRRGQSLVLGLEAAALAAGAACHAPGVAIPAVLGLLPLVFAMGMQNATMHRAGGISIGLTYVTGTLVQIGRSIAGLIGGQGDHRKLGEYAALWLSLGIGAAFGALAASVSTLGALSAAAAFAAVFAIIAAY